MLRVLALYVFLLKRIFNVLTLKFSLVEKQSFFFNLPDIFVYLHRSFQWVILGLA